MAALLGFLLRRGAMLGISPRPPWEKSPKMAPRLDRIRIQEGNHTGALIGILLRRDISPGPRLSETSPKLAPRLERSPFKEGVIRAS